MKNLIVAEKIKITCIKSFLITLLFFKALLTEQPHYFVVDYVAIAVAVAAVVVVVAVAVLVVAVVVAAVAVAVAAAVRHFVVTLCAVLCNAATEEFVDHQ